MNCEPNIRGVLRRNALPNAGGEKPWATGIRPAYRILPDYFSSGITTFLEEGMLEPGGAMAVEVRLITPEYYPRSLRRGDVIEFGSGSGVFGTLLIEDVLDPVLERRD